jgi:hypothetical protein
VWEGVRVDIQLLGAVELRDGNGATVRLDRSAERCVLATLAFNAGSQVSAATLIDNIGRTRIGTETTAATLNGYVRKIRAAITKAGGTGKCLRTMTSSYVLEVAAGTVDYHQVTAQATAAHSAGDIEALQCVLDVWPLGALAGIDTQWAENRRYALECERLEFYQALLEHRLQAGQHLLVAHTVTELIEQTIPTEPLLLLGVRALAGAGHAATIRDWVARAAHRVRACADAELSRAFHAVVETIMADPDAAIALSAAPATEAPSAMFSLPGDLPEFTGREEELQGLLDSILATADGNARAIAIHAIDGMAGVGKTAFTVHAAHLLTERFPDGQQPLQRGGHRQVLGAPGPRTRGRGFGSVLLGLIGGCAVRLRRSGGVGGQVDYDVGRGPRRGQASQLRPTPPSPGGTE